ncbi:MAG: DUF4412 domain-containing protein [Desulfatiglandales bacterium]
MRMKRLFFLLISVCTIGFPAALPAFEGMIIQKNTHISSSANPAMESMEKMFEHVPPEQKALMEKAMREAMGQRQSEPEVFTQTLYIKGSSMRMDFDAGEEEKAFMVLDAEKKVMRNFFPDRKTYLEMSFEEMEQMGRGISEMQREIGPGMQVEMGELKKTGQKKKINGYMCELYTQQAGDYTNEYWITKEVTMKQLMGELEDSMKALSDRSGLGAWQEPFMKIDGFPILTITRNEYGTNQNEVIKIEKKGLSNELFALPAGYQKQSLREMMNQ